MWLLILLVLSVIFIIIATTRLKLHPFLGLLIAAFGYAVLYGRMTLKEVVESINAGFGGTIGYIVIVILAEAVIGTFLEYSGGVFKLAVSTLKLVGKRNVPMSMGIFGYFVSIPIFCDSPFVIPSPLCKSLSRKVKISLSLCILDTQICKDQIL